MESIRIKRTHLLKYIDRFTKVIFVVGGANDGLKFWIIEKGLRPNCMFWEKVGLKGVGSTSELLTQAQPNINYEERLLAKDVERNKT